MHGAFAPGHHVLLVYSYLKKKNNKKKRKRKDRGDPEKVLTGISRIIGDMDFIQEKIV